MLAVGLAVAIGLLCVELGRKGRDPAHGLWMALVVIPAGVLGAKLLFVVEEWGVFVGDPMRVLFAGSGLSFYGGLLLGALAMAVYLRVNRLGFLVFADAAAPGALLARGIARIGCHVSGDGDYGVSTSLPWGTDYSHGIYPPSQALSRLREITRALPDGVVRDDLPMHPREFTNS